MHRVRWLEVAGRVDKFAESLLIGPGEVKIRNGEDSNFARCFYS